MKAALRSSQLLFLTFVLAVLTACASVGVTAPQTFNERLLAAASTVNETQKSAATLVRAGKLSPDDGDNVLKAADAAVVGIGVARSYGRTDPAAGDAKLKSVLAALTALQLYLATSGAK